MNLDLNYLLERKPDFFDLPQAEQLKYIAFLDTKISQINLFTIYDIRQRFREYNLVVPSNFHREVRKLQGGKVPVLIEKSGGFSFHPKYEQELTLELFSDLEKPDGGLSKEAVSAKQTNTEIFNRYDLHPVIKRVAFPQFQDGYYKEAIQNALVEVISQVKVKAGHPKVNKNGRDYELDGDDLMNRVFGCDGDTQPIIAFNSLNDSLDKAEQRGTMNLFKGIVGIRDKKAHLNFVQSDPIRTIEYLSLASLLLRLLDEASVLR